MNEIIQKCLDNYAKLELHNANEAETRKKLIDIILEDILEWNTDDISYEERVSEDNQTTFADYIIKTADICIIVEAKRIGHTFCIVPQQKELKLGSKLIPGDTKEAIIQARDYCRKKNIPFAVVTNGAQWIVFPAVRTDSITFEESTAIFFDSLERTLGEELLDFKSLLSRDSVIEGNLSLKLIGRRTDQFEERRLNSFFSNAANKQPNPIYPLIENEVVTAFSDSISESEDKSLLEKCYVKNADRKKIDNRIEMHLHKKEAIFSTVPKKPMRKRESTALVDSITAASSNTKPLAILILGAVGAGKTTFLEYTRKVSTVDYFKKTTDKKYPHWISIDFREFSQNEKPIDFIYNSMFNYLANDDFFSNYQECIKYAYKEEIEGLKKGPLYLIAQSDSSEFDKRISDIIMDDYQNKKPYVDKLISYAIKNVTVFLVIDNVDQFEDDQIQSTIFSDAMAIASRLKVNLIIAMRETTYVKHKSLPVFDAFDFDPIQIEPPEIPSVLSKRFFLLGQLLKNKQGEFTNINGAKFKVDDLSIYINIIKQSVLGTEIGNRIDILANHDVRLALRMTREFLARGYSDPSKALKVSEEKDRYIMPTHEAFRSILLGNQNVYKEEYSVIGNPFDSRLGKTNSEVLRLFVLAGLVKQSTSDGKNILDGPYIRDTLKTIGYSEQDTLQVLQDLCKFHFITTKSHSLTPQIDSGFFASRLGGYVMRTLLCDFTFLENTMMDTFISDKKSWDELKIISNDIQNERNIIEKIKLRIKRVEIFYTYISSLYVPVLDEAKKRSLDPIWLTNPLVEMRADLQNTLTRVLNSARKNYGDG